MSTAVIFGTARLHFGTRTIEILDLECVLGHVTGVQIENKNALINPPFYGDKIFTEKR